MRGAEAGLSRPPPAHSDGFDGTKPRAAPAVEALERPEQVTPPPSDSSRRRHGAKRSRGEPVTLDLKATELASELAERPAAEAGSSEGAMAEPVLASPAEPGAPEPAAREPLAAGPLADPALDPAPSRAARVVIEEPDGGAAPEPAGAGLDGGAPPDQAGPGPDGVAEPTGANARAEPAAPPAPARRRLGLGSVLAAGLLGGLIGAGASYLAQERWLSPTRAVEPRIRDLEQRLGALSLRDPAAGLEQRLAALENEQKAGAERARAAQALAETNRQRIEEALNRPAAPVAAATPAAAAAPEGGATDPALIEDLKTRLAAVQEQLRGRGEADGQGLQRLESRLAEQDQRIAPLAMQISEQTQRLGAVSGQIAEQGRRLEAVAAQTNEQGQKLGALTQQVSDENQRIAALTKQVGDRGPEAAAALRIVAADQIANALRGGAPYAEALAALRRLNAPAEQLAALEPFAASGAPTGRMLAQEFAPLRERIVAESRPPAQDWSGRLARMAEGVVTVRPIGKTDANTTPGALSRIDDALARGAFKEAAAGWDALPEPARQISADWGRKLKARAAAEDATRTLSSQALAAAGAPTR
jgi:hypothetical protein